MTTGTNAPAPLHTGPNSATTTTDAPQIFRAEALAYYTGGRRTQGDLLRLTPTWTRWTYWLLVAIVLVGLLGAVVGTVDQYVQGEAIILVEAGAPTVVALLPGHVRPLLRPGMTLDVTLTGYPQAPQHIIIDHLADALVGPTTIQQRLGGLAETITVTGPVALVEAHPAAPTFLVDGEALSYHTGMAGKAEVRLRTERILFLLAPALRAWLP